MTQVLGRWVDRSGPALRWSKEILEEVEMNGNTPHTSSTRIGILDDHPDLKKGILDQLRNIRLAGTTVTVPTIHALITAYLRHHAPEILDHFKCSDSWARKFVLKELQWVMRKPTKASRKVPADAPSQIELSFFRHVLTFRDAPIQHPAFRVNMDQTQVVYQMGGGLTFDVIGSAQVPVLGLEEKRAFTLVVAVSAAGDLLPFQAVFQGKTAQSTPSRNAPSRAEAEKLGFCFEYSGTATYWSNQAMMKAWVTQILEPYWRPKMVELNVPSQECLLQLDVWKVHRSQEFMGWMKEQYPWIVLDFVPAGCTGLWQPCDVGIQRPLKLSIKHNQQSEIVNETLAQLQQGIALVGVSFPRDQQARYHPSGNLGTRFSLRKLTNCFQAFRLCKSGDFNLSHESITSPEALRALREIQRSDPEKWSKINIRKDTEAADNAGEEESPFKAEIEDDSAITVPELVASLPLIANGSKLVGNIAVTPEGQIELADDVSGGNGECRDVTAMTMTEIIGEVEAYGRGKRVRVKRR
jgi:hypothetical protein